MDIVNIPSSICDSSYRYKRPIVKIQQKAINGGLTYILNIDKISNSLGRTINDIATFVKKKLGCRGTQKVKILELSGLYSVNDIEQHIEKYIQDNVLCPRCNNPETMKIQKKKRINYTCKACGYYH